MYHDYISSYLGEVKEIADKLDKVEINKMIEVLKEVRDKKGRLFIIGVGGGAGHASHAVNDFRKLTNIETYTPVVTFPNLPREPMTTVSTLFFLIGFWGAIFAPKMP